MKLRDLFKRTPPSPEKVEQQKKEQDAYRQAYSKSRIATARRQGRKAGQHTVGHGTKGGFSTAKHYLQQTAPQDFFRGAGIYGMEMQCSLTNLLSPTQVANTRKKKK